MGKVGFSYGECKIVLIFFSFQFLLLNKLRNNFASCATFKKKDFIGVVTILQLQYWELSLAELGNSLLGFELAAAWTFGCCRLQSATFKQLNKKIKIGRF